MAALPILAPTTCPVLVGRASQLAAVERMVAAVESGRPGPRTLLVSGEAGIGKSRFLAAMRERVAPEWAVLECTCFEPYQAEPYAPVAELLARHLAGRSAAQAAAELGAAAGPLALLPGLERLVPAAAYEPHNQRHLLAALSEVFAGIAARRPLLIAIEDAHWADAATLAFLPLLAHALAGLPAVLAVTYRADEVSPQLAAALAELDRRRLAMEVALARLSEAEVETLLRATLGRPVGRAFRETLYELTDGNPFFIEEIVSATMPDGAAERAEGAWAARPVEELLIPRSVQEAVARRSARLSPAARELLTLAAALGRRFDFATLQRATGAEEAALLGQLKELIAAHLLVEETPDQFAFRHALGRAAVYGGLLGRERRLLHRRLGEALEPELGASHAADLAQHFLAAGVWDKALEYARAAAEQARRLYAPREVLLNTGRALEAAAHLPGAARGALLVSRAAARELLGDFEGARADLETAVDEARAAGRPEDEWQATLGLGMLWTASDYRRAGELFERALALARGLEDDALVAHSLNRVGNWHMNQERPATACRTLEESLAILRRLGDLPGQLETTELLGVARVFGVDISGGVLALEQSRDPRAPADDRLQAVRITLRRGLRLFASTEALDIDTLADATEPVAAALEVLQGLGLPVYEVGATQMVGKHMTMVGELGRALALGRRSVELAAGSRFLEWRIYGMAWLGETLLELGEAAEARALLEDAWRLAQDLGSPFALREAAVYRVRALAAQGELGEAAATVAAALAADGGRGERSLMLRRVLLADAELALARGEPDRALALAEELAATAHNPAGRALPVLLALRGEALAALGRRGESRAALGEALEAARREGRRPLEARLLGSLAGLALAERRRQDAEQMLDEARARIDQLAETLPDAELRAAYRRRALAALPAPAPVTPRQAVKQVFDGLTDRELDVARLIARGYTNRQIAEALVLSERTVGAHVGNILTKLGFGSRVQVARWVVDKGLAR